MENVAAEKTGTKMEEVWCSEVIMLKEQNMQKYDQYKI